MLQVPDQQVLDAVLGVAGAAAAPVLAADYPAAHVAGHFHGQVDDVEQVHRDPRAGQHPAHRGRIDRAHVDRDNPDRVPPGGGGLRQPVRGVIGGAALHLPQQPLIPGQVKEAGVPPVGEQQVFPGLLIDAPPGRPRRCSSMPTCATGAGACSSTGPAAAANASCATGQEMPTCRAASDGVMPRLATSVPACSRSRRVRRQRGGTCGTRSVKVLRRQPGASHFQRRLTHHTGTGSPPRRTSRGRASTVSCRRSETVPQSGHAAATGSPVTAHTSSVPSGSACASVTCKPSTPNSTDAVSWNTMPAAF